MSEQKEEIGLVSLPDLETICPECEADGDYNDNACGPWCPCGSCGGAGHIPTEFGEKVLALIRHNICLNSSAGLISWR